MPDPRLDVLCIGNAIVDVIANAGDDFLALEGLVKGSMRLIDAEEAERLYSHMGPAHQVSGGSAGNTAAGIAALGGRAGFIGQVAPDQLGEFYRHDLTSAGVEFVTPAADVGQPTARSMILVTPDGHRTMNTFLGAAQHLPKSALDAEQIEQLIDTTGAGDLFAAGFLLGTARGKSLEDSLRLGAISAAEVIQHYGARPEANLRTLAGELAA